VENIVNHERWRLYRLPYNNGPTLRSGCKKRLPTSNPWAGRIRGFKLLYNPCGILWSAGGGGGCLESSLERERVVTMLEADSESIMMVLMMLMMAQDRCFTPVNWREPLQPRDSGKRWIVASLRLIRACYPPWALLVRLGCGIY
jgi:hypothetical protein